MTESRDPQTPAVSVIIPAHRVSEYIGEALDSILAQTFRDFEIIVVNDGCPDTPRLEQALEKYQDQILYVKQPNGGCGAARNNGIRAARAEIVAFIDGDDKWTPDYLDVQVNYLRENPEIDIVYPNGIFFGAGPLVGQEIMAHSKSEGDVTFAKVAVMECCVVVSVTARKAALERAGLFNPALRRVEDFDLWMRVLATGGKIGYHRRPLLQYRRRNGSLSSDGIRMREAAIQVLDQLERDFPLNETDRAALHKSKRICAAEMAYFAARVEMQAGNPTEAARQLRKANEYYQKPKFSAIAFGLRWFPFLTLPLMRWWISKRG